MRVYFTFLVWFPLSADRFERYRRLQAETDPGTDMDAHPALLHLDAHVGRRGRERPRIGTYT